MEEKVVNVKLPKVLYEMVKDFSDRSGLGIHSVIILSLWQMVDVEKAQKGV